MKRRLVLLAGLLLVTLSFLPQPSASITFPICSDNYCNSNPDAACRCPSGTPAAGGLRFCSTWYWDCRNL
ncbi:MAG TPA: hypothetical protein VLT87_16175 [Thermoanaerobaculia bacterium]|nr:hypothetical protein [Thermoanaerobaculia bacterium]HSN89082.1 hypothetical protein [Thermoanaerobaculia bacterium]